MCLIPHHGLRVCRGLGCGLPDLPSCRPLPRPFNDPLTRTSTPSLLLARALDRNFRGRSGSHPYLRNPGFSPPVSFLSLSLLYYEFSCPSIGADRLNAVCGSISMPFQGLPWLVKTPFHCRMPVSDFCGLSRGRRAERVRRWLGSAKRSYVDGSKKANGRPMPEYFKHPIWFPSLDSLLGTFSVPVLRRICL
uniref:Uncharacterized protein n=1 Tax=Chromera velia CCMP2878 TaxID=1169474 RepID=A0A0G4FLN8_9ALVE|eukprot:Cvel_3484.t1-p1 / transcript=Cvel_3484.t1 / gene=Cvel_3484 / organism=Chromera_velia_CCMP2878 / gene_product=hypothetical protein / transcript_product=hypothetical protein / location=Cvel_scaffold140:111510-118828(+) / protein_length=191 / sequence_SO=supercontig / SO=protein_coding / is_pseudo=false